MNNSKDTAIMQAQIDRFKSYLLADPENSNLLIDLGDLCHRAGDFEKALVYFKKSMSLKPISLVGRGRVPGVLLSLRRYKEAEIALKELLQAGEESAALLHNLGLALYYQSHFGDAKARFQAAAEAGLANAVNWKYLCYTQHYLGNLADAILNGEKWRSVDESGDSTAYLALLYYDLGDKDAAVRMAEQALLLNPENLDANEVMASVALEEGDVNSSSAIYSKMVVAEPDYGRGWLGYGLVLLNDNDTTGAIAALSTAVEKMPQHTGTTLALGWTKLIAGDLFGAEVTFREAIKLDRNFAECHGGLASVLIQQDRVAEAKEAINLADKLDAENFGAVYAKALLLKREGNDSVADRLIARALSKFTGDGLPSMISSISKIKTGR